MVSTDVAAPRETPTLILDCDGTLADTERYGHLPAFNETFAELGLGVEWSVEDYAVKLRIGGGKERMASLLTPEFVRAHGLPDDPDGRRETLADWHKRKSAHYVEMVESGLLPARPGIRRLLTEALAVGWTVAVASTSAVASVEAVVRAAVGPELAERIPVFAGDAVPKKKPAPDIYLLALSELGADPATTLAVEDSRNGFLAARDAGLACVVTVNGYTSGEDFAGAALVVSSFGDPGGETTRVLADPDGAQPGDFVTLDDLHRCLGVRVRHIRTAGPADEGNAE